MTREEAEKIAAVILTADGGCVVCIRDLANELNQSNLGWTFQLGRDDEGGDIVTVQPQ